MVRKRRDHLHKAFVAPTENVFFQFLRYTVVGGLAFVVDFGLLFVLTEYFRMYYLLSATISFIAGLLVNYLISLLWVFKGEGSDNKIKEFTYFALIGLIGLLLNSLFLWLITDCMGVYYMLSKMISAGLVYLWNFGARKYFLFSNKKSDVS